MKLRITIDPEHIARQVAEQCIHQNDTLEAMGNYLIGAAYAVSFSISRTRKWEEGDFVKIGKHMIEVGTAHYLTLKEQ
ncbi:hypothetical protein [Acetobacter ascendens]|uniref:Uncharacterized protein n=1 Tax=Acetobacter ascendens TaxID=481146 RepID=A0A1D8R061_9PROT|nr:hypothetical protein [Acetobacter ascendens]RCL04693.1 hypothetical protein BBA71_12260 [Acetobacter pasteurianus]GCD76370.1 hypothetical protein NBRC3299_2662 [Acetobacter pasteurianus NBRC 3299]AOW47687.1 hypothetical protein A4S02_13890 [Acetobacter ascendens]AOW47973.1 hypothetical protein A4S02_14150 [Acetobacter ascendens]AOW50705.1 hypothetical protein A4R89_14595 [Acetobacter ascendens]